MDWDWLHIIVNPIGYLGDHKSVGSAADDYYHANPPSNGIELDTITEIAFKTDRQEWVDACAGQLKSWDNGYSKANCEQNCAARFDQDSITEDVRNAIDARAAAEKAAVQASLKKNATTIIIIIAATLIIGILLYLFLS